VRISLINFGVKLIFLHFILYFSAVGHSSFGREQQ